MTEQALYKKYELLVSASPNTNKMLIDAKIQEMEKMLAILKHMNEEKKDNTGSLLISSYEISSELEEDVEEEKSTIIAANQPLVIEDAPAKQNDTKKHMFLVPQNPGRQNIHSKKRKQ